LNFLNGFKVPVAPGDHTRIRLIKSAGKPYTVQEGEDGVKFAVFAAGTSCFAESQHRVQIRPEIYVVTGGDHRGNPLGVAPRKHTRPQDWVEDFGEHLDSLSTEKKKG
jgi:hypothetical protein